MLVCSNDLMQRITASTAPTGSTPMAVSAARTRPCTPSSRVLAMSFISAMVALRW